MGCAKLYMPNMCWVVNGMTGFGWSIPLAWNSEPANSTSNNHRANTIHD